MQRPYYGCAACSRVRAVNGTNLRDRNRARNLLIQACANDVENPHETDLHYRAGFAPFPRPVGQDGRTYVQ